jgi:hypothetical protein
MLLSAKTYGNTFCLLGVDALTGEKTGILKCPKMQEYIRVYMKIFYMCTQSFAKNDIFHGKKIISGASR